MDISRAASRVPVAWANGAGSTTEVARSGAEPFDWRISVATIDRDARFSELPGLDRILLPLAPHGLALLVNGARVELALHQPMVFAGEDDVASTGVMVATLDLNVMTRRGRCTGGLDVLRVKGHRSIETTRDRAGGCVVAVVALTPGLAAAESPLELHDAIVGLEQPVDIVGYGAVAVITISNLGEGDPE